MENLEVKSEALTVIQRAENIVIFNNDNYIEAGNLWKTIKDLKDKVNDSFKPIIEKAHEAHKEALAQKAKIFNPLDTAGKAVKSAMEVYDREQERKRREEQSRLEAEAKKAEEERRLQAAIEAEKAGKSVEAEMILDNPVHIAPVFVPKETPKMTGGPVYREIWKVKIIDEGLLPREFMIPDTVKLGQLARTMKDKFSVPGAESYSERV